MLIERKRSLQVKQGNGDILHRNILETKECPYGSQECDFLRNEFLKLLIDSPGILNCNNQPFESLSMKYLNGMWVVETQAIEKFKES